MIFDVKLYQIPLGRQYQVYIEEFKNDYMSRCEARKIVNKIKSETSIYHISPRKKSDCRVYVVWRSLWSKHVIPLDLLYIVSYLYHDVCRYKKHKPLKPSMIARLRRAVQDYIDGEV